MSGARSVPALPREVLARLRELPPGLTADPIIDDL